MQLCPVAINLQWMLIFLLCAHPALSQAQPYPYQDSRYTEYGVDFALDISHLKMDLESDGQPRHTTLNRFGISLYDAQASNLTYGMLAGSSYLDMDDEPAIAGEPFSGYYFGLALRADLIEQPRLRLGGYYLFQQTDASSDTGSANLDWYEWQLYSSLRVSLGPSLGVVMTGAFTGVDADLHIRGDTPASQNLSLKGETQGQIGLEMLFPGEGRASISLVGGNQSGIRFEFGRVF